MTNEPSPMPDHVCTVCHSVDAPVGGGAGVVGAIAIAMAIAMAFTTHDGNVAVASTPVAIAGLASVLRSRSRCPRCSSEAIVPLSTPRGQALVPEALRPGVGGS